MDSIRRYLLFALLIWMGIAGTLLNAIISQPFSGFDWRVQDAEPNALQVSRVYPGAGNLKPGEQISAFAAIQGDQPGQWLEVQTPLLAEEADATPTYAGYDAILAYNRALYEIVRGEHYYVRVDGEIRQRIPIQRPISSIRFGYWISALTSLIALLTGVGIWAFQTKTRATRFLLLSGALYSFGSLLTVFYTHRHLVMSPKWFETALSAEHLLMGAFPYALLALLLSYPRQVVHSKVLVAVLITPLLFWLNETFRWTEIPFHAFYMNTVVALLLAVPSAILQRRAVRNNPVDVGGLRWFLLSIFTAPMVGVGLYLLPPFFGVNPQLPLWSAHLLFLTLYLGFSLGVARYRLFDIERWWFKVWISFISGVLLMVADFLLVSAFNIEADKAMMLAIAVLAWIYFPLRQGVWRRLSSTRESKPEDYLPLLVDAVLEQQTDQNMSQAWSTILSSAFQPSEIQDQGGVVQTTQVTEHGLFLDVPGVEPGGFMRLVGRSGGTRLFSLTDQALANSLFDLFNRLRHAKTAHQQGARLERSRIIRDLHDDVGANLLTLSYRAEDEEQAELARATLKMLRETIYALDDEAKVYLNIALTEWRAEVQTRVELAEMQLDWQQQTRLPNLLLRPRQRINLGRILREGVSNAIKYSQASQLCVCISQQQQWLQIRIENPAGLESPEAWVQRKGMNNIRIRAQELGGEAKWSIENMSDSQAKVKLTIRAPLF